MPNRVSGFTFLNMEAASIRQILDASNSLDGDNLRRLDRSALGRAHLALSGAVSPLARSPDLVCAALNAIQFGTESLVT